MCDGELCLCASVSLRCVRGSGVYLSHRGNVSFCFSGRNMSAVGEVRCLNGLQLFGKTSVVVYTVFRDIIVRGIFGKTRGFRNVSLCCEDTNTSLFQFIRHQLANLTNYLSYCFISQAMPTTVLLILDIILIFL